MAKKKKGRIISVDFTGVESGGGGTVPEDKYEVKVVNVEESENEGSSGFGYLNWEFVITDGDEKGKKLYNNTSLAPQSLWNLRNLLEVLGVEVPQEPTDIDLDDLVDRTLGVEIQHETYNGKPRNRIVDFFSIDDEEEEKPAKKGKKAQEEDDEEEETPKKSKKPKKSSDDEDDEPVKKKSKKKASLTADEVLEKDEDELQELIDEHELEVDLSEHSNLRRKRASVVEALEEAGLIEEDEEA